MIGRPFCPRSYIQPATFCDGMLPACCWWTTRLFTLLAFRWRTRPDTLIRFSSANTHFSPFLFAIKFDVSSILEFCNALVFVLMTSVI